MSIADQWLRRYGENHEHAVNRALHCLSIPLIIVAVVGLLWSAPIPEAFSQSSPALNWGMLFLMASVVYYFVLSFALAIGMLPFVTLIAIAVVWLDGLTTPLWIISAAAFAVAGAGQIIGHAFERRSVSLFTDLNLVMIGPLWLLAALYQRLRIPY